MRRNQLTITYPEGDAQQLYCEVSSVAPEQHSALERGKAVHVSFAR